MSYALLLCVSYCLLFAQRAEITPENWNGDHASVNCVFLTAGPGFHEPTDPKSDWCKGFRYRVSFMVTEIYYSILIEKLSFEGWECSDIFITNSYFYKAFKIGDLLKLKGELGYIEFLEWLSFDSFKIQIHKKDYFVKILKNGNCRFTKL